MTRTLLIASALCIALVGAASASAMYFRPVFIFGQASEPSAQPAHGVPSHAERKDQGETGKQALRLVERLGAVQDKIIRGDRSAIQEQGRLLNEIARQIRRFGDDDWNDYVTVRTSLLFVLSGGDAHVLDALLARDSLSPADENLASGIMKFAEGQSRNARDLFEGIDPRSLDVSLVGPFALARASLYLDDNAEKAIDLLDDARLACPHTAIDEAAARREIPILLNTGNTSRAMMLTVSYVREFGKSIYAMKFFRDFAEAAAKRPELDDTRTVDRLADAFEDNDAGPASDLLIDVAGEALLQGRLKLAGAAANRVLAMKSSPESLERARLYAAAAEAPSSDATKALKALDQITVDRLSDDDTEIREVAGFIAKTVVGGSDVADTGQKSVPDVADKVETAKASPIPTAMKASAALKDADAILNRADLIISGSEK